MAKKIDPNKQYIKTELGKRLQDYNGETPQGSFQFVRDSTSPADNIFKTSHKEQPGYMGGVSAIGEAYDYTPTSYDGSIYAHQLGDLEDIRAQNQGVLSSLANSTANFIGKTAVNTVGGLVGAVYGAGSAIANGKISELWDNDVTDALDKASDSIGEMFKVYKSSDYNDKFILNKMVSNPIMFADEFMDTLSFTAGAVLTEMISGGMASAAVLPKATKYLNRLMGTAKSLDKVGDIAKVATGIERAGSLSNIASGLERAGKLSRQLATGAFWEASVEARQLGKEMTDKMTQDYIEEMAKNGIDINPDQIPQNVKDDIDERVKNASLATMALNVGLVGFSNISQFPTIFKSMGTAKRGMGKELVSETVDGVTQYATKFSKLSKLDKNLMKTWAAVKNPFMEGFVEEGGQGVISGTMGSFFDRKNDIEGGSETEKFLNAFGKAFIDTYATKEGLNEVLMGALIGGVGSPGAGALSVFGKNTAVGKHGYTKTTDAEGNETFVRKSIWDGGVVGGIREFNEEQQEAQKLADTLNQNPSLTDALIKNYESQVRAYSLNKELDDAVENNNHFEFQNTKDNLLFNYVQNRLDAGLRDDLDFKVQELSNMSPEDFYVTFKGEDAANKASKEDMQDFQDSSIENFEKNIEAVAKADNTVNALLQGLPLSEGLEGVALDLKYYLAKAEMMTTRQNDIYKSLGKLTKGLLTNQTGVGNTVSEAIKNLRETVKDNPDNKWAKDSLVKLMAFQTKFGGIQSATMASNFNKFVDTYPSEFKANEEKITSMLQDLPNIELYRKNLIKLYDSILKTRNILKYSDYLTKLDKHREDQATINEKDLEDAEERKQASDDAKAEKDVATDGVKNPDTVFEDTEEAVEDEVTDDNLDEIDRLEEEAIEATPDVKSEMPDISDLDVDKLFEGYLQDDGELISKILPSPTLVKIKGVVEARKSVYVEYRNSRTDLADIGTERDIKDFNYYINNVRNQIDINKNWKNPKTESNENNKVPTETNIEESASQEVKSANKNTKSSSIIRINKSFGFRITGNKLEYFDRNNKPITNNKKIQQAASLIYNNKGLFNSIVEDYLDSNALSTFNNYFDKLLIELQQGDISDDSVVTSPELELMQLLLGAKFLREDLEKDLPDLSNRWYGSKDNTTPLDSYVANDILPIADSLGLTGLDEKDIIDMIKDIISQYPKGITKKAIKEYKDSIDPNVKLDNLRTEFLDQFGLNLEEIINYIANEKVTESKGLPTIEESSEESGEIEGQPSLLDVIQEDTELNTLELKSKASNTSGLIILAQEGNTLLDNIFLTEELSKLYNNYLFYRNKRDEILNSKDSIERDKTRGIDSNLAAVGRGIQKELISKIEEINKTDPQLIIDLATQYKLNYFNGIYYTRPDSSLAPLADFGNNYINRLFESALAEHLTKLQADFTQGKYIGSLTGIGNITYENGAKDSITGLVKNNWDLESIILNYEGIQGLNTPVNEDNSSNTSEVDNTTKIVEDALLIEKQVNNLTNKPEIPVSTTTDNNPNTYESEELLDAYRGVSLTNIHAKKSNKLGKFESERQDGKYVILDTYPKDALNPNLALPGTQVEVRIPSEDEYHKYTGLTNYADLFKISETIPLAAYQDGKFLGFVLTPQGAKSSSKNKISQEDLIKLGNLRKYMDANRNKTVSLNVLDKSNGMVTYRKDENNKSMYRPINEHLSKDGKNLADDVHIVVDVNGVLHSHKGYEFNGQVINHSYGNGMIYTLVPLPSGSHVKVPLRMASINTEDANTVIEMIKLFTANSKNPNDVGFISARNELQNESGINLGNLNEFYSNIANILYINSSGESQFFTRTKEDDGYYYTIKSPSGHKPSFTFKQTQMHDPKLHEALSQFITENFYRGVKVEMMNASAYQHLSLKDGKLKADRYDNYVNYIMNNNILYSDVYGESIDDSSNKMSFALAPFIKVEYPSTGNYRTSDTSSTTPEYNPNEVATSSEEVTKDSILDDLNEDDDYDINFSMLDVQNSIDEIISPDVETEIDNFIKFCK